MSTTVDLLPASLQNTLHQIVHRVNACNGGIRAILLSTAEGVPLGRIYADQNAPLNEDVLSSIESTWAPASKQFPLLNMGKEVKTVMAVYDHGRCYCCDGEYCCIQTTSVGLDLLPYAYALAVSFFLTYMCASLGTILHVYQAPVVRHF
jgi:hypothetical protein